MSLIVIAISSILVSLILGATAVLVAILKYRESADLGEVRTQLEALRAEVKRADTKEIKERLATLEGRAGVRMF